MRFTILIVKHVNHLLDKSFPSGFAFSDGVMICCVASVVMKIDNDTLNYYMHHNVDPLTLSSLLLVYTSRLMVYLI